MKFKPLFFGFFIFIGLSVYSQTEEDSVSTQHKNTLFFEFGGNSVFGGFYSLNYQRTIEISKNNWFATRFGFSLMKYQDGYTSSHPIMIDYIYGKRKDFLDVGIGFNVYSSYKNEEYYNKRFRVSFGYFFLSRIMYRHIYKNGFLISVGLTPYIFTYYTPVPMIGLDLGYSF